MKENRCSFKISNLLHSNPFKSTAVSSKSKTLPKNQQTKAALSPSAAAEGSSSKRIPRNQQGKASRNQGAASRGSKSQKRNQQNKESYSDHKWKDYRANISKCFSLFSFCISCSCLLAPGSQGFTKAIRLII